jgi:hypothetical protein
VSYYLITLLYLINFLVIAYYFTYYLMSNYSTTQSNLSNPLIHWTRLLRALSVSLWLFWYMLDRDLGVSVYKYRFLPLYRCEVL